jgi:hypothetical protein
MFICREVLPFIVRWNGQHKDGDGRLGKVSLLVTARNVP